jgi:GTPase SAR1 family protein
MCALIVYDITQESTFKSIPKWVSDLRDYAHPEVVTVLVGNKCDLTNLRQVEFMKGKSLCEELKMNRFLETSALENINVETAFFDVIGSIQLGTIDHLSML